MPQEARVFFSSAATCLLHTRTKRERKNLEKFLEQKLAREKGFNTWETERTKEAR